MRGVRDISEVTLARVSDTIEFEVGDRTNQGIIVEVDRKRGVITVAMRVAWWKRLWMAANRWMQRLPSGGMT